MSIAALFFMSRALVATTVHMSSGQEGKSDEAILCVRVGGGRPWRLDADERRRGHLDNRPTGGPVVPWQHAVEKLVSRNERNRMLVWEVDGPNFYRSSSIALDGAASPRSYFFMVKDLPGGEFDVRATVKRNDSSASVDRSTIMVVGGPNETSDRP